MAAYPMRSLSDSSGKDRYEKQLKAAAKGLTFARVFEHLSLSYEHKLDPFDTEPWTHSSSSPFQNDPGDGVFLCNEKTQTWSAPGRNQDTGYIWDFLQELQRDGYHDEIPSRWDEFAKFKQFMKNLALKDKAIDINQKSNQFNEAIKQKEQENREKAELRLSVSERYRLHDIGNSERFAEQHKDITGYCESTRSWAVWNDKIWEWSNEQAKQLGEQTAKSLSEELISSDKNTDDLKPIVRHIEKSKSAKAIRDMIDLSRGKLTVRSEQFDTHKNILVVENGTLYLDKSPRFEAFFKREHYITKQAPVRYDPNARCEEFDNLLGLICNGDDGLIRYLKMWLGLCLTGNINERKFLVLDGYGRNGKSTLIGAVMHVLGIKSYAYELNTEQLLQAERGKSKPHSTDIYGMKGKRMVVVGEPDVPPDARRSFNSALLKKISGGDVIDARACYQDAENFELHCKVIIQANTPNMPRLDDDQAVRDRLRRIHISHQFSPNDNMNKKMRDWLSTDLEARSGILNSLLEGLRWYYEEKNGLDSAEPECVTKWTTSYFERYSPTMKMIGRLLVKDRGSQVGIGELLKRIEEANEKGFDVPNQWSERTLKQPLIACGLNVTKTNQGQRLKDYRLKTWEEVAAHQDQESSEWE